MGSSTSKDAQLEKARQVLEAAQAATGGLKARLEELGFDSTKLHAGYQLYTTAGGAELAVFGKLGDQEAATQAVTALRAKVEGQYSTLVQIAKQVFDTNLDAQVTLGIRESVASPATHQTPEPPTLVTPPSIKPTRPSRSQAAVLARTHRVYDSLLADEDFGTQIATAGYSQTRLQAELADVTALEAADIAQEGKKGDLKGDRLAQKAARAELKVWLQHFTGIVTAGLKDHPEWLTTLTLKAHGGKG